MTQTVLLDGIKIKDMPFQIIDGDRGANYPKGHEFTDSGFCLFLSAKNVTSDGFDFSQNQFISSEKDLSLRKGKLQPRDLVLTTRGTVGNVAFYDSSVSYENIRINSGMVILRCDESVLLPEYLYFVLRSNVFQKQVLNFRSGSAQPQLPIRDMQNMKLPLPGIETQKRIAEVLGRIDEKIELNRAMNETLEQMGQALFCHYFVDNPEAEGWEDVKFADVADILTGKGSTKSQISEDGYIPLYGANGVMGLSEDYLYDEPLVITGRVGTLGAVRAVTGKAWFSDNVLIMRPKVPSFGFVYSLAKTFDYVSMNRGSSQPLITQTDLRNRTVKLPSAETLKNFEEKFSPLFSRQQNNNDEIQTLTTLRDTLLPRLIGEKVKV